MKVSLNIEGAGTRELGFDLVLRRYSDSSYNLPPKITCIGNFPTLELAREYKKYLESRIRDPKKITINLKDNNEIEIVYEHKYKDSVIDAFKPRTLWDALTRIKYDMPLYKGSIVLNGFVEQSGDSNEE